MSQKNSALIVYVIFNLSEGKGGHSLSLAHLIDSLKSSIECCVVNISLFDCEPLTDLLNVKYKKIDNTGNPFEIAKKLSLIFSEMEDFIIHAFDEFSYSLSVLSNTLYCQNKSPIILTKCGGPNPKSKLLFPKANDLIVFSEENYDWFANNNFEKIHYIPNRLSYVHKKYDAFFDSNIDDKFFKIICISRITSFYRKKLISSIMLVSKLIKSGLAVKLTIIGKVESDDLLDEIIHLAETLNLSDFIVFKTENIYTHLASGYIHYFDSVIATGRGVMEGSFFRKVIFVPVANFDYPELLSKSNFDSLFRNNFSERSNTNSFETRRILTQPLNGTLFENNNISEYSTKLFLLEYSRDNYLKIYSDLLHSSESKNYSILNVISSLTYFFYRNLSKKLGFGLKGKFK